MQLRILYNGCSSLSSPLNSRGTGQTYYGIIRDISSEKYKSINKILAENGFGFLGVNIRRKIGITTCIFMAAVQTV
ncbi:MAG: hypothetical protein GX556_18775 [Fibrobacter sp.]|nr:hypothetical protein [Fibrobacter sp.]